jgi:ketosteroid isomerase-like protein
MNSAENEIMELIEKCSNALNEKNLDALFEHITDDVELFDVVTQTSGVGDYRKLWEQCLPFFGDKVGTERKDVKIHAGSDLAFVHCFTRVTGVKSDNENAKSWLRTTICLKKINGAWKIAHEHISLPFDVETRQPAFILD